MENQDSLISSMSSTISSMPDSMVADGLLPALYAEIFEADFVWQILAFALALSFAFFGKVLLQKQELMRRFQILSGLIFPILAVVFLACGIAALEQLQLHFGFLDLATALASALILVEALVMMVRSAFPNNRFLSAYEKIIALAIWLWMALYITDIAPLLIARLDSIAFVVGQTRFSLWRLLNGMVLVLLVLVLCFWLSAVVEQRLMHIKTWDMSLRIIGVRIVKAFFLVLGGLMSLSILGINMTALSVFTGALGVGLGFGFQKIASNYVSGFIILFERSIQLGNFVSISGLTGKVTQITTRFTVLKNAAGEEIIVPNEMLVSNIVQNKTLSDSLLKTTLDIGISYGSDVDLALRIIQECALNEERVLKDPAPIVLLNSFGDFSINLTLGFWIKDPENGTALLSSNINRAIWQRFKEEGVEMPFPQREVRILKN